jgi:hypothetical protein
MTQADIDRRMEELGLKIYTTTGLREDPKLRAIIDSDSERGGGGKSKAAANRNGKEPSLQTTMLLAKAVREKQKDVEQRPNFRKCPRTPRRAHTTDADSCGWSCNTGTFMSEIPNAGPDDPMRHECVPCVGNCMPGLYLLGACPAVGAVHVASS